MAIATTPGAPDIGPHRFDGTEPTAPDMTRRHFLIGLGTTGALIGIGGAALGGYTLFERSQDSEESAPLEPLVSSRVEATPEAREVAIASSTLSENEKALLRETDYPVTLSEVDTSDPVQAAMAAINNHYAAINLRSPELLAAVFGVSVADLNPTHVEFAATYPFFVRPEFLLDGKDDPDNVDGPNDDFAVLPGNPGELMVRALYSSHLVRRTATPGSLSASGFYGDILATDGPVISITTLRLDEETGTTIYTETHQDPSDDFSA